MTPFEEELQKALRRLEPTPDFTARVLARSAQGAAAGSTSKRVSIWWRMLPVAAAFLVIAGGAIFEQHEHEVRGLAAKHQLLLAVRIAGSKLHDARQQVMGLGRTEIQE